MSWKQEVSEKLKKESLDSIRREFNKLVIDFPRHEIIKKPQDDWRKAYYYSGSGSTFRRQEDIKSILERSVPPFAKDARAKEFKDSVKMLLETSISNCEMT